MQRYSTEHLRHANHTVFITGEGELSSTEGTTQGDALAMATYALAVTPLIQVLSQTYHKFGMPMMVLLLASCNHFLSCGSTYYRTFLWILP